MTPQSTLIVDFTLLLGAALVGGMIAHRLKQPIMLGYLVIGAVVGPHALGFVRNLSLIEAVATIGVALLMLTLGLEVSFVQLRQVGKVGLWGGIAQILVTFAAGTLGATLIFRWSLSEAALFGLIISLSSTTICLKILMERGELDAMHGRIMIAILILQDISVVLMMVLMPILGLSGQSLTLTLAVTLVKAAFFVGVIIVAGVLILPWLMGGVGGVRTRELFLLTVLVLSLAAALGTQILGLSAVFGAFLIGLVLRETRFAHQALAEISPLRDIFAALFFVSLGMLLDLEFVANYWSLILVTVGLILFIKFSTVFGIVRLFGYGGSIALLAGAGLFQISEFGFVLARGGADSGLISAQSYSLVIGAAIFSMLLTPVSMSIASGVYGRLNLARKKLPPRVKGWASSPPSAPQSTHQVVIAGFGRIGQNIARGLNDAGISYSVVEIDPEVVLAHRCDGVNCVYGDASNIHVLSHLDLTKAKILLITFPDPLAVVNTARTALGINPKIKIMARVHQTREFDLLNKMGVEELVNPEYEASLAFLRKVFAAVGLQDKTSQTPSGAEHDQ